MALNSGGSTTCDVVITVKDKPIIWSGYSIGEVVFQRGIAVGAGILPSVSDGGGVVVAFTGMLPLGLAVNETTGEIGGVPTEVMVGATYQISEHM